MSRRDWLVVRQDDNGNTYVVGEFETEADAQHVALVFEHRGHKQLYSVCRRADRTSQQRL